MRTFGKSPKRPKNFKSSKSSHSKKDSNPSRKMVVSNPYSVAIERPDLDTIDQRVQISVGDIVYEVMWDNATERVICLGENHTWYEVRSNAVASNEIKLINALQALNIYGENRTILTFTLQQAKQMDDYLNTAVSMDFLAQMEIVEIEEEPMLTNSDIESIESDSDDPLEIIV